MPQHCTLVVPDVAAVCQDPERVARGVDPTRATRLLTQAELSQGVARQDLCVDCLATLGVIADG